MGVIDHFNNLDLRLVYEQYTHTHEEVMQALLNAIQNEFGNIDKDARKDAVLNIRRSVHILY